MGVWWLYDFSPVDTPFGFMAIWSGTGVFAKPKPDGQLPCHLFWMLKKSQETRMFESILLKQQLHKVLCQFIVWINTVDQESPTSLELHVLCNKKNT